MSTASSAPTTTRFDPLVLLRPAIRDLVPFSSARGEAAGLTANSSGQALVWLDANESPWPPYGDFAADCHANRYPDPQPQALRDQLAKLYGVAADQILMTRGSEEIPDLLIRSFCQSGRDGVVLCPPTFAIYQIHAAINASPVRMVPLRPDHGYDLDVEGILAGWQPHEKLLIIPSPNAPMGHMMGNGQLTRLLDGLSGRAMVVIDEAYQEFTGQPSWAARLADYPNLMVMRTLSKSYGLAGARLGSLLADARLIAKLAGVLPAYPLSAPTIAVALEALSLAGLTLAQQRRAVLVEQRQRLAAALAQDPAVLTVFPSEGNFLLLQTRDAAAFMARCQSGGVIARNRSADLPNAVRVTVGSPEENDRLLQALAKTANSF